ncbi:PH domain-containing protein [Halalkalibacillus halophilus]|uniref:PH domain-containing protein n=1 Tax=Halalkalibacillus halophilus TaxID=392827 RepID=UPI0003F8200A|nr:PH domain-containing protein [Halalkalibacillus halophilus]
MSNGKRLHPTAIIFKLMYSIKNAIYVAIPPLIASFGNDFFFWVIIGVGVLFLLFVLYSVVDWLRFTYAVVDDELRIHQGIFIRNKRSISKHRIQSIDLTQGVLHRIFKLTKVSIETAGSNQGVDAALSSVTFEEGKAVQDALKSKGPVVETEEEQQEEPDYPKKSVTNKELVIAGSTSGSIGVILGLMLLGFSEVERFIPESAYDEATRWILALAIEAILGLVIFFLVILWGLGILGTVIKYGRFTITRYEDELFITRGLLEKKQMTIPLKRIQAVGIKESLIRQPLGFASVYVEIAGGEVKAGSRTLLFPIIKKANVEQFLHEILPEYQEVPTEFTKLPTRALPYYIISMVFLPAIITVAVGIFLTDFIYLPIILAIAAVLFAILKHRTHGSHISEQQITFVTRDFSKDTILVKHKRIQSFEKRQHFLQRKQNLATVRISMLNNFAGRHESVSGFELEDADHLSDWYSLRKRAIPNNSDEN